MTAVRAGEQQAVAREGGKLWAERRIAVGQRQPQQKVRRQQKANAQRQGAGHCGQPAAPARQATAARLAVASGGIVKASATTRAPFDQQHEDDKGEQRRRQLCRSDAIAERKPGAIDASREGLHAKIGNRAIVSKRLHQGQCRAGRHGRPGQRQRDAEEASPGSEPERARGFQHAAGAFDEGRTGRTDRHTGRARRQTWLPRRRGCEPRETSSPPCSSRKTRAGSSAAGPTNCRKSVYT